MSRYVAGSKWNWLTDSRLEQLGVMDPAPAQDEERQSERQEVDGQLGGAVGALAPYPVFEVVEHVHPEEIQPGAAARQEPEQGDPTERDQTEGRRRHGESQPRVGQRKGLLELQVGHRGL